MKNQQFRMIIALHGVERNNVDRSEQFIKFRNWIDDFCGQILTNVTDFSCTIDKDGKLKNGKNYRIKSRGKVLQQELEEGKITQLDLYSLPDGEDVSPAFDWNIFASMGQDYNRLLSHFELGILVELIKGYLPTKIETLIKEIVKFVEEYLDISYGYGFIMPHKFFPSGYAVGIAGEGPNELVRDANSWQRDGHLYCGKLLRNVFPISILNNTHLDIRVGNNTLNELIEQSQQMGKIEKLNQNLFIWSIFKNDPIENSLLWDAKEINCIRNLFKEFKIFPWQNME